MQNTILLIMKEEDLLEILNDWNFRTTHKSVGIVRSEYLSVLEKITESNIIVCISGIRRAGKSFILRQFVVHLLRQGIPKNRTLIVNFEDRRLTDFSESFLGVVVEVFQKYLKPTQPIFIFLDEIQKVNGWE